MCVHVYIHIDFTPWICHPFKCYYMQVFQNYVFLTLASQAVMFMTKTHPDLGLEKVLGEMFTERTHQLRCERGGPEWVSLGQYEIPPKNSIQRQPWSTSRFHLTSAIIGVTGTNFPSYKEFFHRDVRKIINVQWLSSLITKSAFAMVKLDVFFLAWPS